MALSGDGRVLATVAADERTSPLVDLLRQLLGRAGYPAPPAMPELEAIGVATGPGRYSGLRRGIAFAKGLCAARATALVGVPTEAAMRAAAGRPNAVVLIPAGRGRLYACGAAAEPELIETVAETEIVSIARVRETLVGAIGPAPDSGIEPAAGVAVQVTPAATAAAVAKLALRWLRSHDGPASDDVTPRYAAPAVVAPLRDEVHG
jgi:tRNA threonylcarbamoyladenosine biosynthesis protein TsaB